MKNILITSLIILGFILSNPISKAQVKLPAIVSDGMVLQRNEKLKIWGWAKPGEKVAVTFNKKNYKTVTASNGKWQVVLKPQKEGGPYSMTIKASNTIILKNILIGDVWVCSGQSNMQHHFRRHYEKYAKEIAEAKNPEIRQFLVPRKAILTGPTEDNAGVKWIEADPKSLLDFTVVGYFFVKKLYDKYKIPMGIINTSVGGTKIESWTSEEGLKEFPDILQTIIKNKDTAYVNKINREAKAEKEAAGPKKEADLGIIGKVKWYDPAYQAKNWKKINIPGYWEDQGVRNLDGVVWYRREFEIPKSMIGKEVKAYLGRIIDADELFVNGKRVGVTYYQYPQRRYTIPAGLLKPGKNLFVVRVKNNGGKGGFIPNKPYYLSTDKDTIDLKGYWEYRVGEVYKHDKKFKRGINAQNQPTSLYNGMVAPYINYAIKGMVWYQGESNWSNAAGYKELLSALIKDWRNKWQLGNITFLIAQLPNFNDVDYLPVKGSSWALIREAQLKTAMTTPNTGIGVNIELGEWNDIHPENKKPVGERLALQAMQITYGETDIVSSGPIFKSQRIEGNKIILSFDHVGSGLASSNGEELNHFAIAGDDKKFRWGKAKIINNEVVVSCDGIPNPKYVRYAWADNPDFANLANKEGLPASPFRTDE